jgi:RNA-directed DNA polymerase
VLVHGLAEAFLAGSWDIESLVDRGGRALDRRYRWLRPVAERVLAAYPNRPRPRVVRLAGFLWEDAGFRRAYSKQKLKLRFTTWQEPEMTPAAGPPTSWPVPAIATPADLAGFLDLAPNQLEWFADCQSREGADPDEPLRHYRYRWVGKPSGSLRLIEAPKPRLKQLQRKLLDAILLPIPPHDAAHGFRPGRSVTTFVTPHVGQTIVLKMDLRDFFVSITSSQVIAIYLTAGYPEGVAQLLTGLCTNTVPLSVWNQSAGHEPGRDLARSTATWRARRQYREPHLPQGAPTSPALANLAAYRLDARLAGLARTAEASYTRYADDLVFSGGEPFARMIARFPTHVAAIALDEGFHVQHRKTQVMRQGVRQRAAGVVINQKINITRNDYDQLKAILCNCARHGPQSQNRAAVADFRAHLTGRVAHVARLNTERGQRLMRLFERIVW